MKVMPRTKIVEAYLGFAQTESHKIQQICTEHAMM